MVIRKAGKNDVKIIARLLRNSFRDVAERFDLTVENCPKSPAFCTVKRVRDDFERGFRYYILEDNGRPRGCVALERANPDVCYLERLAVLPQCRRKGYGTALVNHMFDQAREKGAQRVEIALTSKDRKLKKWYRKFGFKQKNTKKFEHLPFIVAFMFVEIESITGKKSG